MVSNFHVHRVINMRERDAKVEYKIVWRYTWETSQNLNKFRHTIHRIVDTRKTKDNIIKFKVDWKQTWVPSQELHCPQEIIHFHAKRGNAYVQKSSDSSARIFAAPQLISPQPHAANIPSSSTHQSQRKPFTSIQPRASLRNPPTNFSSSKQTIIIKAIRNGSSICYVFRRNGVQELLQSNIATKIYPLTVIKYWEQRFSCLLQTQ